MTGAVKESSLEICMPRKIISQRGSLLALFTEDLSVLSEDVASLMSPDERFDISATSANSPTAGPTSSGPATAANCCWLPQNDSSLHDTEYGQELISKGPPKAEVQLR